MLCLAIYYFLIPLLLSVILENTFAVKINELLVPEIVQFGSPALLDCNYTLEEQDLDLVVKWYFQRSLIYQWIPTFKPVVSGAQLRGQQSLGSWYLNDTELNWPFLLVLFRLSVLLGKVYYDSHQIKLNIFVILKSSQINNIYRCIQGARRSRLLVE